MEAVVIIGLLVAAFHHYNTAPREQVTLLPNQDGTPSAVVVSTAGAEVVLDQPYQSAAVARSLAVSTATGNADAVRARYAETLAALPQRAAVFTVYFETGTEALVPESATRLASIKDELGQRPAPEVVVIGHTDRVDSTGFNDALSLKRAEYVKRLLVDAGIPADAISVAGRGEREPAVATADGKDEQRNRRVEIRVR